MVNKMLSAEGNIIRINFSKKMSIGISVAEICAFVSSLVFGLALYNKWITKLIINPDVLLNGIVYKYGMQWEDSLGRIGLRPVVYMKGLFVLPGFTALITIVLNAAAAALLCRLFEIKKNAVAVAVGIILCCSPSFCELMTYYYCSDAYMWACLCSILFVYFAGKKSGAGFSILAAALLTISLTMYQAYLGTAVTVSLFFLIYLAVVELRPIKDLLRALLRLGISGAAGILVYLGAFGIYSYLSETDSSERIGGMGTLPLDKLILLIKQAYGAFYTFYVGNAKFYHQFMKWGTVNLVIIAFVYLVIAWRLLCKRKEIRIPGCVLVIIMSLMIPLAVMSVCVYAYTADIYDVTGILMVPHINYIYVFLLCMLFCGDDTGGIPTGVLRYSGSLLTALITFILILYTQAYAASVEQDFNQADTVADIMLCRLSELPEYRHGMKLAVFGNYRDGNYPRCGSGSWEPTDLENIVKGTGVEWGCFWPNTGCIEQGWISFLAYNKGCWFTAVGDDADMNRLSESDEYKNMKEFPLEGSVGMIGDTAVVKLSE